MSQRYDLVPYRKDTLWGYCDTSKKILIDPQFNQAVFFEGEHAVVKKAGKFFLINTKGEILSPGYRLLFFYENEKCYTAFDEQYKETRYSFKGKVLGNIKYTKAGFFDGDKYAIVEVYGNKGLVDTGWKEILPCEYTTMEKLPNEMLQFSKPLNGQYAYGFRNMKTGFMVPIKYQKVYPFNEGLSLAKLGNKWGFIDSLGTEKIPFKYDKVVPEEEKKAKNYNEENYIDYRYDGFSEGLAVLHRDTLYGFIDKTGKEIIPFIYQYAYGFKNGLAWVKKNGKWGMVNKNGIESMPCEYDMAPTIKGKEFIALESVNEKLIRAIKDKKAGFCNTQGKVAISFRFDYAARFANGLAPVKENGKWGFINWQGEKMISSVYDWVVDIGNYYSSPFDKGYAIVYQNNRYSLIDKKGKQLTPTTYDREPEFINGLAVAKNGTQVTIINTKGQVVYIHPSFHYIVIINDFLIYDYDDKCYINIKTKMKYCN